MHVILVIIITNKMNFLRKTFASTPQIPKANHGTEFASKEKQYYEMEAMLKKLMQDVRRYTVLIGELLACKTSIYGYLLYFYSKKSEKRVIIDDLFKYHSYYHIISYLHHTNHS